MGLIGGMARTAVIAGTATAVGNRVSRRQANRWAEKDQSAYAASPSAQPQYAQPQYAQPQYAQPQYAQPQYAQPQYAPPQPAPVQYAQPAPRAGRCAAGRPRQVRPTETPRGVPGPRHPHGGRVRAAEGSDPVRLTGPINPHDQRGAVRSPSAAVTASSMLVWIRSAPSRSITPSASSITGRTALFRRAKRTEIPAIGSGLNESIEFAGALRIEEVDGLEVDHDPIDRGTADAETLAELIDEHLGRDEVHATVEPDDQQTVDRSRSRESRRGHGTSWIPVGGRARARADWR